MHHKQHPISEAHQVREAPLLARHRVAVVERLDTLRRQHQEPARSAHVSITCGTHSQLQRFSYLSDPQSHAPRCWKSGILGIPYFFLQPNGRESSPASSRYYTQLKSTHWKYTSVPLSLVAHFSHLLRASFSRKSSRTCKRLVQ